MTSSIVSVSGTYWSGSSILVDIFSEHPSSRIVPDEFSIFSYGQLFYELNNAFSGSLILARPLSAGADTWKQHKQVCATFDLQAKISMHDGLAA